MRLHLKLSGVDGPVVCFDLETTGVNSKEDRILELGYVKIENSKIIDRKSFRFNPGISIPAEASAVNHIFDKDVLDCPSFSSEATNLFTTFSDCHIMGFNIESFDLKFLKEEFQRCGIQFSVPEEKIIDVYKIYKAMFNQKLTTLYSVFCGKQVVNAHSALGDCDATLGLLTRFLDFEHIPKEWKSLREEVIKKSNKSRTEDLPVGFSSVDEENKLLKDPEGKIYINFGKKHKNKSLQSLLEIGEEDYLRWILSDSSFQPKVKEAVSQFMTANNIEVREPASRR